MAKRKIIGIVLAAGKGKRMRSQIPKVLHPVAGVPMALFVIDALRKAGIKEIITVVGHGKEKFKKVLPDTVKMVDQGEPLGTGHAVNSTRRLLSKFNGDILVACADMPLVKSSTVKQLILRHRRNGADCTLVTGRFCSPQGYGRILRDDEGNVINITEHIDTDKKGREITEVNSGMYCFASKELFKVLPSVNKKNRQKEYYLTDTIDLLVKRGCKVNAFTVKDSREIIGVNSRKDITEVGRIINQRIIEYHMKRGVTIVDPDTTYIDIRARIGGDTVINPLTMIEGEVTIGKGCIVGPFTHLRDKAVLRDRAEVGNFVEVKKSTVGKHTKAKHLTYLGDTVLGNNVNIGAGTITANYDGKNKYKTVVKDRAFIGSHTTIVAPVTVGKGAVTGAGSVVLRGRNVPPGTIVVGVPARELRKNDK